MDLRLLQLLQLSDSALPIGAAAHSFGLESLVADELVTAATLQIFLHGWLIETGAMEAWFCRAVHHAPDQWFALNEELSAAKLARESRQASLTLGRRLLALARRFLPLPDYNEGHHALAFGLIGSALNLEPAHVTGAYLHQSLAALISAAQRLLPLGQFEAARILWDLKPLIASLSHQEQHEIMHNLAQSWHSFTTALDLASFRHPYLETRLFIS